MKKGQRPLVIAYGYPKDKDDFEFIGRQGTILICGYQQAFTRILPLCNGHRTIVEIASDSHIALSVVSALISVCERHGLIVESRELYRQFHLDSANPSAFSHDLSSAQVQTLQSHSIHSSQVDEIQSCEHLVPGTLGRRSVRSFTDATIPTELFTGLLGSMYRVQGTRSVPSAGALYPLTIFAFVLRAVAGLGRGIFRYDSSTGELRHLRDLPIWEEIVRVFDTREVIQHATVLLVVTGLLDRSPTKYSNRGYRYTLLEAGHVAQNAYIFSTIHSDKVGLVEYGGFQDEDLASTIGLPYPTQAPLITLICGVPGTANETSEEIAEKEAIRVRRQQLVGVGKPIENVGIWKLRRGSLALPRWAAAASYRHPHRLDKKPQKSMRAFATSPLIHEAIAKVMSEAYERFCCDAPYASFVGSGESLAVPYIDPTCFAPYHAEHPAYEHYGLTRFRLDQRRAWVRGQYLMSPQEVMVPSDLLFFTQHPLQDQVCYRPNSSGVAAHPEREKAIESGLLELIERDAIAVTWYSERVPASIPSDFIPSDILLRKKQWEASGWDIRILNITLEMVPTVLVLFRNKRGRYPALSSGAGTSLSLQHAIEKAFVEAEYMALSWMGRRYRPNIEYNKVTSPEQHGLLYAAGKASHEVDFLFDAPEQLPECVEGSIGDAIRLHNPVVVDMNQKQHVLAVCRVLSASLLPLTFGYASEHYGHNRMDALQLKWKKPLPAFPHFFP